MDVKAPIESDDLHLIALKSYPEPAVLLTGRISEHPVY